MIWVMSSDDKAAESKLRQQLRDLRSKIDTIDSTFIREVVNQLTERREIVREIGEIKDQLGEDVRDSKRRSEVVSHWKNARTSNVSGEVLGEIASAVVGEAERVEKKGY